MNKYTQERKAKYIEELLETIGKSNFTFKVEEITYTCHRDVMIGSVFFDCDDREDQLMVYCTPASDQYLGGIDYPEDHNRVDISFSFVTLDGDEVANFQVPIVLNWHDPEVDALNYFAVVEAIIKRELSCLEVGVVAA